MSSETLNLAQPTNQPAANEVGLRIVRGIDTVMRYRPQAGHYNIYDYDYGLCLPYGVTHWSVFNSSGGGKRASLGPVIKKYILTARRVCTEHGMREPGRVTVLWTNISETATRMLMASRVHIDRATASQRCHIRQSF